MAAPFEEMHRRQNDIAARRRIKKKKFSLLLSNITVPSSSYHHQKNKYDGAGRSNMRCAILALVFIVTAGLFFFTKREEPAITATFDRASVRNRYWRASVVEHTKADTSAQDRDDVLSKLSKGRPFNYIGDIDPAVPQPWPEEEKDWHALHETLARRVRDSDAATPAEFDINVSRLPQLIFYGDSITEGWLGTSFGSVPGKSRMWSANEHKEIRELFKQTFGAASIWGKRALKPPLVLGISGSRTYDFLWRIQNGEFPTSTLLEHNKAKAEGNAIASFQLDKLERVYIVLMGTNNLGGGMLPGPTIAGMNATGRKLLQRHADRFPHTPAALIFSELLPRRDDFRAVKMCPPRCANVTTLKPYTSFMPAIEKVNRALPEVVQGWRREFTNSRIVLLTARKGEPEEENEGESEGDGEGGEDSSEPNEYTRTIHCAKEMFAIDDRDEFDSYMPDRLHPNARGYELWSRCLKTGLEVVMDHAISLTEA